MKNEKLNYFLITLVVLVLGLLLNWKEISVRRNLGQQLKPSEFETLFGTSLQLPIENKNITFLTWSFQNEESLNNLKLIQEKINKSEISVHSFYAVNIDKPADREAVIQWLDKYEYTFYVVLDPREEISHNLSSVSNALYQHNENGKIVKATVRH